MTGLPPDCSGLQAIVGFWFLNAHIGGWAGLSFDSDEMIKV